MPGLNNKGQLTLGENIGDLGGLNIAYTALMETLASKRRPATDRWVYARAAVLPRVGTGVGGKGDAGRIALQVETDPHSWAQYQLTVRSRTCPNLQKPGAAKPATRWSEKTLA